MHAASADRVIHTCYCYGSFSYVFKLKILLDLFSSYSTPSIQIYFITAFAEIGNAECVQSKPYQSYR